MNRLFKTASISFCALALSACAHTPSGSTDLLPQGVYGGIGPSASINVLLGDAPPDLYGRPLAQLNLGVKEVDAIQNGQTTVLATFQTPLVVNVLKAAGSGGEIVANAQVTRVQYDQLRLVVDLGTSNGVFADGTSMPLTILTNTQTHSTVGAGATTTTVADGLSAVDIVVTQPFSIPETNDHSVRVDFNAFESLDLRVQGGLVSETALFVAPVDDSGSVFGRIVDRNGRAVQQAVVVATAADGSIGNTADTGSDGTFKLRTLRSGKYSLTVYNSYTNAAGRLVTSSSPLQAISVQGPAVTVSGGDKTNAGILQD